MVDRIGGYVVHVGAEYATQSLHEYIGGQRRHARARIATPSQFRRGIDGLDPRHAGHGIGACGHGYRAVVIPDPDVPGCKPTGDEDRGWIGTGPACGGLETRQPGQQQLPVGLGRRAQRTVHAIGEAHVPDLIKPLRRRRYRSDLAQPGQCLGEAGSGLSLAEHARQRDVVSIDGSCDGRDKLRWHRRHGQ
ncbi:MAG TPA: hypothetical protein VNW50_23105 [Streptosporangiaceae bacterium]|nr:hypothetical protein [Streptosporangiaceae bacterium]